MKWGIYIASITLGFLLLGPFEEAKTRELVPETSTESTDDGPA
ncbi:MAG: hypothetical protein V5A55_04710 [Halovenus sp.]